MMLSRAIRILPLLPMLLLAQPAQDPAALGRKALDLLLAGNYPELSKMFTAEMKKAIPDDALGKIGAQIKSWGAVEKIGDPTPRKVGPNTIEDFPVKAATQNVILRFNIDRDGLVAGMFFLPGEVAWNRPAYSKPDSFRERDVTVGEGQWKLPATLTVPAGQGPFPAIVLVHGSGPNDRDETVGGTKVFKDLAEGLASRGVVVLRYEKRTRQYSAAMAGLASFTVEEETVEDAVKGAALLRAQPEVNPKRVFVLGHSLGGYLAPRIAEEDGKLAGLVVLAGAVRPMEDAVVDQAEYLGVSADNLKTVKAVAAKIKSLEPGDEDSPPVMGAPVAYWLDLKGYDPAALAKKLALPMLILQGERDFQVTMKDFALWKAAVGANKAVTMRAYPALNHLFVAGEGKGTEAEYRKPGHVAPEVIDDIAKFVSPVGAPGNSPKALSARWSLCQRPQGRANRLPLHRLPRLQRPNLRLQVRHQLAQLLRPPGERRERAEVHRDHLARAKQFARQRGLARAHGEQVADRQNRQLRMVELFDQVHVRKHVGIAGEIERAAIGEVQHVTRRLAAVDDLAVVQNPAAMHRVGHGHRRLAHFLRAALVHGPDVGHALGLSQLQVSKIATTSGENRCASGIASCMWS
jgi:dienelactone hydrolase